MKVSKEFLLILDIILLFGIYQRVRIKSHWQYIISILTLAPEWHRPVGRKCYLTLKGWYKFIWKVTVINFCMNIDNSYSIRRCKQIFFLKSIRRQNMRTNPWILSTKNLFITGQIFDVGYIDVVIVYSYRKWPAEANGIRIFVVR